MASRGVVRPTLGPAERSWAPESLSCMGCMTLPVFDFKMMIMMKLMSMSPRWRIRQVLSQTIYFPAAAGRFWGASTAAIAGAWRAVSGPKGTGCWSVLLEVVGGTRTKQGSRACNEWGALGKYPGSQEGEPRTPPPGQACCVPPLAAHRRAERPQWVRANGFVVICAVFATSPTPPPPPYLCSRGGKVFPCFPLLLGGNWNCVLCFALRRLLFLLPGAPWIS